jgi:hypothetical protein
VAVFERFIERELTGPADLCTADGQLNEDALGWSRKPLHNANLSGRYPRKKRWEYWCITSPTHLFSATVADLDYAAQAIVYVMDFERKRFHESVVIAPFGRGCSVDDDETTFDAKSMQVTFRRTGTTTEINIARAKVAGTVLDAQFDVRHPPHQESCNVVIPCTPKNFVFTSKHQCLPASGEVGFGPGSIAFNGHECFACLDRVRGIWPYKTAWQWGAASGVKHGRTIGLNLGGTWTDGTSATENAFTVDGRMTKVSEDLSWEYDHRDYMQPWTIRTPISGQVKLEFTPFYERVAKSNLLVVQSNMHQMFGHFSGTLQTDNETEIEVDNLLGWVENHRARW